MGEIAVGLEHVEEVRPRGLRAPAGARLRAGEAVEGVVDLQGIKVRGVVRKLARGGGEGVEVAWLDFGRVPVLVAATRATDEESSRPQGGQEVEGLGLGGVRACGEVSINNLF